MDRSLWQLDMLDDFKITGQRQPEPFYFGVMNLILDCLVNTVWRQWLT